MRAPAIFRKRHEAEEITPLPGPDDIDFSYGVSGADHLKSLQQFEKAHKFDPNFPLDDLNDVDAAIATGNAEKGIEIEHALMEDNSPYPEVCFFATQSLPPSPVHGVITTTRYKYFIVKDES